MSPNQVGFFNPVFYVIEISSDSLAKNSNYSKKDIFGAQVPKQTTTQTLYLKKPQQHLLQLDLKNYMLYFALNVFPIKFEQIHFKGADTNHKQPDCVFVPQTTGSSFPALAAVWGWPPHCTLHIAHSIVSVSVL